MESQGDESPLLSHNEYIHEGQRENSNSQHKSVPEVKLSRKRFLVVICILVVSV